MGGCNKSPGHSNVPACLNPTTLSSTIWKRTPWSINMTAAAFKRKLMTFTREQRKSQPVSLQREKQCYHKFLPCSSTSSLSFFNACQGAYQALCYLPLHCVPPSPLLCTRERGGSTSSLFSCGRGQGVTHFVFKVLLVFISFQGAVFKPHWLLWKAT